MAELDTERTRLYPVAGGDGVRALLIHFVRASDWATLANLYQSLQEELELPAPAVSVSGSTGFALWLSLAEPVSLAEAEAFLQGLYRRYLSDIPPASLRLHPPDSLPLVPALHPETGKWSAYIDPSMGEMFRDEPWLEMAPNPDKQADILARLGSIRAPDFQRALATLQAPVLVPCADEGVSAPLAHAGASLAMQRACTDPKSFLLAVMNDSNADPALRVEAAKALLPYFNA